MKKDNCILFIYQFPYKTSEPFMETEIEFLSKRFNKIFIFSININKKEKQTRTVPNNVKVFPLDSPHKKIINVIRGAFVFNRGLSCCKKNLSILLADLYTRGRMHHIYRKALKILLQNNFDGNNTIFYSYWLTCAIPSVLLKNYFQKKGCKNITAISRGHGYDIYSERNKINHLSFQNFVISKLDFVAPCSKNGKDYLSSKFEEYSSKIETSRLGTRDYGLGIAPLEGEKILLTCGRFRDLKRIPLFSDAFARVVKTYPNCKWICIGSGEEKNKVLESIARNKTENNIDMVGRLPNKKVLELYKNTPISYFINVSSSEGVPVSIMEAMSFGIPTIATDVGGTSEIVDCNNGLLISPNLNADTLAEIIIKELSISREKYLNKRKLSRENWERKCSTAVYEEWANKISN